MALPNTFVEFMGNQVFQMSFLVGAISLIVVFAWPLIKHPTLKKIPAPLVVLVIAIPVGMFSGLTQDNKQLVKVGDFWSIINFHADFSHISDQMGTFIQYVALFAIIGSLESLLTGKAIDLLDPYKRKSNFNKDLIAVGVGNAIAGALGGLPITRWANFFHGFFIFLFLIFAVYFSDLIPKTALSALLIGVGWKLTHPREFGHMAKIGKDQIAIFITTIIITLISDLLLGIAAGVIIKMLFHVMRGVKLKWLFRSRAEVKSNTVIVHDAAVFSNFIPVKKKILSFEYTQTVTIDFRNCYFVDHTVIEMLYHIRDDFAAEGGELKILGVDELSPVGNSKHPRAALRRK